MNMDMHLNSKYFFLINKGLKDIEIRLCDTKRSKLKINDTITFISNNKSIQTRIINITKFNSFEDLLKKVDYYRIGLLDENISLQLDELYSIYPKEKVDHYKIMAIELKKE